MPGKTPSSLSEALGIEQVTITKLDAARRQLRTAIDLWFSDGEAVSIHSLASAAHQVIHDMNRRKKGPPLLFDAPFIKEENKKEFVGMLKSESWFFKHADRGKMGLATSIQFNPLLSELFIVVSLMGLKHLGESLTNDEVAFLIWVGCNRPHFLDALMKENFEKTIPIKEIAQVQSLPKLEFLHHVRKFAGPNKV